MNEKPILTVRQLHNGNIRLESCNHLFLDELAKVFEKWTGKTFSVDDTEVSSGSCWYAVFDPWTVKTAEDEAVYYGDTFKVTVDLIEWFEDDTGQYQERGLPRTFDAVYVPNVMKDNDDAIGDFVMNLLESMYRIKPVLVSWTKEGEDNNGQEPDGQCGSADTCEHDAK